MQPCAHAGPEICWWGQSSAYAACSAKRRERKDQHRDGIDDRESQEPGRGAAVPQSPGDTRKVEGEERENRAGGFVKKLACSAPHDAQRDFRGVPQRRIEACRHSTILVHIRVRPAWSNWPRGGGLVTTGGQAADTRHVIRCKKPDGLVGNCRVSCCAPGSCFGLASALRLV